MNYLLECREHRLAEYVDAHTGPSDNVYIWDTWSHSIHVLVRCRLRADISTRICALLPISKPRSPRIWRRPPKLVIINKNLTAPPPCVLKYVAEKCTPVGSIDYFDVFRLSSPGN